MLRGANANTVLSREETWALYTEIEPSPDWRTILLCSSCHAAHHAGRLRISGTAAQLDVQRAHVGVNSEPLPDRMATAVVRTQAKAALTGMGWKPTVAVRAVDAAIAALDHDAPLERVIFESLQQCPRPAASG
jgi:hypothetical protein